MGELITAVGIERGGSVPGRHHLGGGGQVTDRAGRAPGEQDPQEQGHQRSGCPAASSKAMTSPRKVIASGSAVACGTRTRAVPTTVPLTVIGIRCTGPSVAGLTEGLGEGATVAATRCYASLVMSAERRSR